MKPNSSFQKKLLQIKAAIPVYRQKARSYLISKYKENPASMLFALTLIVGILGLLFSIEPYYRNQRSNNPFNIKVQAECTSKAGFNPGQGLPILREPRYYERMKEFGMNATLGIAESTDSDLASASAFVEIANANGVTPIIRFCVATSSCDNYKDPNNMASFIRQVANAGSFAVILGPNEPDIEHWNGTNFFELGKYSATVANQVQDLNHVQLLSVAFNASHHLNMNLKNDPTAQYPEVQEISDYFRGLGDKNLLDGIAMNAYNVDGVLAADRVDYFLSYMDANGFGLEGNFSKVYITEFGFFKDRMPSLDQLKESYSRLSADPRITSVLFFVPFSDMGNPGFSNHHLSLDEFANVTNVSAECRDQSGEEPVVTPISPSDPDNPDNPDSPSGNNGSGSASGIIANSELEYCPKDKAANSENCIPYVRYYDEPSNELLSCQAEKPGGGPVEQKTLEGRAKLSYDAQTNSYKGQILVAGQIRNFPMLRHFGSGSYGEYGQNASVDPTKEGTLFNPYQPVCSFLSEVFPASGNGIYLTHEYDGKVVFYDSKGGSYEYAMPRLGSGLSCLNLLSTLNPLSTIAGHLTSDFPGFSIFTMTKEERKIASCKSKHALYVQNRASFEEIVNLLKNDEDCKVLEPGNAESFDLKFDTDYPMSLSKLAEVKDGEPFFDYTEEYYCSDSKTYSGETIRYVNNGSNRSTESYKGPAEIIGADTVNINLSTECSKPDGLFLIRDASGASLKPQICDGTPEVADAYFPVEIEAPTFIGIPGGHSAFSILTEYVQRAAENKVGKIVTPPNGVRVISEFAVISSEGEYEVGQRIDDLGTEKVTVEYIVPYMDYQPLFVALQYVFNNENDSAVDDGKTDEN